MHFAPIATNKRLDAQASKGDVCVWVGEQEK